MEIAVVGAVIVLLVAANFLSSRIDFSIAVIAIELIGRFSAVFSGLISIAISVLAAGEVSASLIYFAVAVIVFLVAAQLLGEGKNLLSAGGLPPSVSTSLNSGLTNSDAFGHFGATVARSGLSIRTLGCFSTSALFLFIDHTVAIVIEAVIADLPIGGDLAGTISPKAVDTELFSTLADSDSSGILRAGVAGAANPLVDLTIAIVILTAAALAREPRIGHADHRPPQALTQAISANSGLAGIAGLSASGVPLVDLTVAIVILTVADLGKGSLFGSADDPAVGTDTYSLPTDSGLTGTAGPSSAGVPLVDLPIAIVILTVANFGSGARSGSTDNSSPRALSYSPSAVSGPTGVTRFSAAGVPLVDLPIAIVILTVANFTAWFYFAATGAPLSVIAGLSSVSADPSPPGIAGPSVTLFGLSVSALGRGTSAGTAPRIIAGDPSGFAAVADFIPSFITEDRLSVGGFAENF